MILGEEKDRPEDRGSSPGIHTRIVRMVVSRAPLPLPPPLSLRRMKKFDDLWIFNFFHECGARKEGGRRGLEGIVARDTATHPPVSNPIRRRFRGGKQDVESSCPARNVLSIRYARDICTRCWYPGADYYSPTERRKRRSVPGFVADCVFPRMNEREERERYPLFRSAGNFLVLGGF